MKVTKCLQNNTIKCHYVFLAWFWSNSTCTTPLKLVGAPNTEWIKPYENISVMNDKFQKLICTILNHVFLGYLNSPLSNYQWPCNTHCDSNRPLIWLIFLTEARSGHQSFCNFREQSSLPPFCSTHAHLEAVTLRFDTNIQLIVPILIMLSPPNFCLTFPIKFLCL